MIAPSAPSRRVRSGSRAAWIIAAGAVALVASRGIAQAPKLTLRGGFGGARDSSGVDCARPRRDRRRIVYLPFEAWIVGLSAGLRLLRRALRTRGDRGGIAGGGAGFGRAEKNRWRGPIAVPVVDAGDVGSWPRSSPGSRRDRDHRVSRRASLAARGLVVALTNDRHSTPAGTAVPWSSPPRSRAHRGGGMARRVIGVGAVRTGLRHRHRRIVRVVRSQRPRSLGLWHVRQPQRSGHVPCVRVGGAGCSRAEGSASAAISTSVLHSCCRW